MTELSDVLELTCRLIRERSISPADAGCQRILAERLAARGFTVESLPFGEVANLWALHGSSGPLLLFAGHTDVVPPGPIEQWHSDPFEPVIDGELLTGRGAADMKGSLAAMVVAAESFVAEHPNHPGRLAFLITSDEEGDAIDGTARVVEELVQRGIDIDWCLVGEPTSEHSLGDTIKVGRRGSLNAELTIRGTQGHVAYPAEADNPIHRAAGALEQLIAERWDEGNEDFPATSLQVTNIAAGTGASNVIPGEMKLRFNLRFSPETTVAEIQQRTEQILNRAELNFELAWQLSGLPFYSPGGPLTDAVCTSIVAVTGQEPRRSTGGGTSDGRFIAPAGAEVVEFGPSNATIHKANEQVAVGELERLVPIYRRVIAELLG